MEPVTIMMPPKDVVPIGIMHFVHGMAEHRKRYEKTMEYWAKKGYVCAMRDLKGHGENVESPEKLGIIGERGYKHYIDDVHDFNVYLKREYPGIPLILIGHSMGSLIVRTYIKRHDEEVDCLIISGSPSNNKAAIFGKLLIRILAVFNGYEYKSPLIANMVTGAFEKPFANEGIKNSWLSSDVGVATLYNKDPLCGFTYSLNGYKALLDMVTETYSERGWRLKNPRLRIAFLSGADDPCRTNDKMFKKAIEHMRNVGYKNVTYKLFPGMRHEIFNEIKVRDVFDTMEEVIKAL